MTTQTQESTKESMDVFLDLYKEFDDRIEARAREDELYLDNVIERGILFAIYVSRLG